MAIENEIVTYGRQAFEFIEHLESLSSADEVMDVLEHAVRGYGFKTVVLSGLPGPNQRYENLILGWRCYTEWFNIYIEEQYFHDDPRTHLLKRAVMPFEWCETLYDEQQSPRAVDILGRRKDFGLEHGFVVPSLGIPNGKHFVSMTGHKPDLTAYNKLAISLMALYGLHRVRSLLSPRTDEKPVLTAREREVLTWVAHGKSAWEIGEILTIAKRTVDEHAQTAFRKLGAVNRTQAVAIALRDRLIHI